MKKYIYTTKKSIHIFDLHKTLACFDKALDYLSKMKKQGKVILFVSTKQQANPTVTRVAQATGMPYVTFKWIPGFLTNFTTINKRLNRLKKLREMKAEGDFEKYTKKEASKFGKEIIVLEQNFGGVEKLDKVPDCVFVVDVVRDFIAVKEAKKMGIPVVALVDTNADPDMIDYPIPANDDAIKSIGYLLGKVAEVLS